MNIRKTDKVIAVNAIFSGCIFAVLHFLEFHIAITSIFALVVFILMNGKFYAAARAQDIETRIEGLRNRAPQVLRNLDDISRFIDEGKIRTFDVGSSTNPDTRICAIADGYRLFAKLHGGIPSDRLSDEEILEIHSKVKTAFTNASIQRNEKLPDNVINFIALEFLYTRESLGKAIVEERLIYEQNRYLLDGLRPDHWRSLDLLSGEVEELPYSLAEPMNTGTDEYKNSDREAEIHGDASTLVIDEFKRATAAIDSAITTSQPGADTRLAGCYLYDSIRHTLAAVQHSIYGDAIDYVIDNELNRLKVSAEWSETQILTALKPFASSLGLNAELWLSSMLIASNAMREGNDITVDELTSSISAWNSEIIRQVDLAMERIAESQRRADSDVTNLDHKLAMLRVKEAELKLELATLDLAEARTKVEQERTK